MSNQREPLRQLVIQGRTVTDPPRQLLLVLTDFGPSIGFRVDVAAENAPLIVLDLDHWDGAARMSANFSEVFAFFQEAAARRTAHALGDGGQSG